MEKFFTVDWENIPADTLKAIQSGKVTIRDNGMVAYWAKGSGKKGIVAHLPVKEVVLDPEKLNHLPELMKAAKVAQAVAIGVSTAIVIGAIVVQTRYLSKKIDKLQERIDVIYQDIDSQNVIYFMDKISEYFGLVESARILLSNRDVSSESKELCDNISSLLLIKRNEIMSLIDNLLSYANNLSDRHLGHVMDFVTMMLRLIPKSIYIECSLCDRYGKYKLANHIINESGNRYRESLGLYREWANGHINKAISGVQSVQIEFDDRVGELKGLFNSKENEALLEPLGVPAVDENYNINRSMKITRLM